VVDKYGIPVLRFHYRWSDHERLQAKHMHETFERIITEMGGIPLGEKPGPDRDYGLNAPGEIIHEVGTIRMGENPQTSALNKWQQAHDVKNLFVTDAAPFVSQGDKNCTWTILALSMRAAQHIISEKKAGNL
jgi:choline dehydrogenase-like flavoprotein